MLTFSWTCPWSGSIAKHSWVLSYHPIFDWHPEPFLCQDTRSDSPSLLKAWHWKSFISMQGAGCPSSTIRLVGKLLRNADGNVWPWMRCRWAPFHQSEERWPKASRGASNNIRTVYDSLFGPKRSRPMIAPSVNTIAEYKTNSLRMKQDVWIQTIA